jgi:hypothetical protein
MRPSQKAGFPPANHGSLPGAGDGEVGSEQLHHEAEGKKLYGDGMKTREQSGVATPTTDGQYVCCRRVSGNKLGLRGARV